MIYLAWTLIIAHYSGIWVYPIFEVLSPPLRFAFMAVCSLVAGILYLSGEALNNVIWSSAKTSTLEDASGDTNRIITRSRAKKPKKAD